MYTIIERFMQGNSVVAYSLMDCDGVINRNDKNTVISLANADMITNATTIHMINGTDRLVGVGCMLSDLPTWKTVTDRERESEETYKLERNKRSQNDILDLKILLEKLKVKLIKDYSNHSILFGYANLIRVNCGFKILATIQAFGGVEFTFAILLNEDWRNKGKFIISSDVKKIEIKYNSYADLIDKISTFMAYSCIEYGLEIVDKEEDLEYNYILNMDFKRLRNKIDSWQRKG